MLPSRFDSADACEGSSEKVVDFGDGRRGEPELPKLMRVRAPMATDIEISGNKDQSRLRMVFASERDHWSED
jgi:hypothetical protein